MLRRSQAGLAGHDGQSAAQPASAPLTFTTILMVIIGVVLPFLPLGKVLGFTALPARYLTFHALSTQTYLVLVELAKRRLLGRRIR